MKNSYRVGLGFIILPPVKRDIGFFEGIEYRFGFEYDNSYFEINNEQINRFGIGLGFGIPINKYNSIDIGINYYIRGKTDNGFIKDNLLKITAGINIGELWFLKPKED
jgi:outer membrane protein assembly factor BamA